MTSAVPINDEIDDAIALPGTPGSLIGTTVDATPTAGLPSSSASIENAVWYGFIGTGASLTVDTELAEHRLRHADPDPFRL